MSLGFKKLVLKLWLPAYWLPVQVALPRCSPFLLSNTCLAAFRTSRDPAHSRCPGKESEGSFPAPAGRGLGRPDLGF